MASFSVTAAGPGISVSVSQMDPGTARASFVVTNTSSALKKCELRIKPIGETPQKWFSLEGAAIRPVNAGESAAITVVVTVPKNSVEGNHRFCLVAMDTDNKEEDYIEGEEIVLTVKMKVVATKGFPLWIILAIIGAVLVIGTIVTIIIVATANAKVAVPDVIGKKYLQADSLLRAKKLAPAVAQKDLPADTAIWIVDSQVPASGEMAAKSSIVALLIKLPPAPRLIADVVGLTYENARTALLGDSLRVKDEPSLKNEWIVYSMIPPAGTEVQKNSEVTLLVEPGEIPVPDLVGLTKEKAEAVLKQKGFTGELVGEFPSMTIPTGAVADQKPAAGAQYKRNAAVRYWTRGLSVNVPVLAGKTIANAMVECVNLKLMPKVIGTITDAARVTRSNPPEGTVVLAKSEITLYVPGKFNIVPFETSIQLLREPAMMIKAQELMTNQKVMAKKTINR